ncbi:MAG: DNA translocase FtsK 4TM domain-containing protein [Gammaproteobacteria bacterium AqS3]|nr:DNA translocase FtsK 4TM domain-containing protein [Gammaproteobacteria bacterium AqS3]
MLKNPSPPQSRPEPELEQQDFIRHPLWVALLFLTLGLCLYAMISLGSYDSQDSGVFKIVNDQDQVSNWGGALGAMLADFLLTIFGYPVFILPLWLVLTGLNAYRERGVGGFRPAVVSLRFGSLVVLMLVTCALAAVYWKANWWKLPGDGGGWLGKSISGAAQPWIGGIGFTLLCCALGLGVVPGAFGVSWLVILDRIGAGCLWTVGAGIDMVRGLWLLISALRERLRRPAPVEAPEQQTLTAPQLSGPAPVARTPQGQEEVAGGEVIEAEPDPASEPEGSTGLKPVADVVPRRSRERPSLGLLNERPDTSENEAAQITERNQMAAMLEEHLANFGVRDCEVINCVKGPVVSRFELELPPGTKASRIATLSTDLARSLMVPSVRVQEIIPGKSCVGVEIPNKERQAVYLKDLLDSDTFAKQNSPLSLVLGQDISGAAVVIDLMRMPHLLVAGTTGSGKSVGLNAMLMSLLYKSSPEDVKLIMIDPKMLELSLYKDIPHLLTPVITDVGKAINALRWCVEEMERRYALLAALQERNLEGYNAKMLRANNPETPPLPIIVVIIDEFADMMMALQSSSKKAEELIARLAQKSRAAGIHLILATQRPSADVITGLIKSNIPARLAYQVSSSVDSRVILDRNGAEQLLGYGDGLFIPPGTSTSLRVHGAFVSNDEVNKVARFWRSQGKPEYIGDIVEGDPTQGHIPGLTLEEGDEAADEDRLYPDAVEYVRRTRKASISSVQRQFKIGYNRAARLVESMERHGIVSAQGDMGVRQVIAPPLGGGAGSDQETGGES